jgi:carboxymethylenebutenolidase
VTLEVPDGTSMQAFLARPDVPGRHPGLILLQEAFGVDRHIRDMAARFAGEGYVVIAPELFHRTAPGFEGDYGNFPAVMPHIQALTPGGLAADLRAAFELLAGDEGVEATRIAALGYCMGGRAAFLANATLPLAAAVSYYGGGISDMLDRVPDLSGPQLLLWAGRDARIRPEHVHAVEDALRTADQPFASVLFSHSQHGFFNDQGPRYDPIAAREAWALTIQFLADRMQPFEEVD